MLCRNCAVMGLFDFMKKKDDNSKSSLDQYVTQYEKLIVAAKTPEELEQIMLSEPPFYNKPDELGEWIGQTISDRKYSVFNAETAKEEIELVKHQILNMPFSIEKSKREVLAHLAAQEITKYGMYRPLIEGVHQAGDIAFILDQRAKSSKIYVVNNSSGKVFVQSMSVEGPRNTPYVAVGERKEQYFRNANDAVADYLSKYAINAVIFEADLEFKIEKIKKYYLDQYGVFVHSERPLRVIKERSSL
jgi:hypothetical protein